MKEDFLQYIWANSLYKCVDFTTLDGRKARILYPGEHNRDAGPDFFNARLCIDGVALAGNIEIHLKSSDWYQHGHHLDPAYNNVILSVVNEDDMPVYNQAGGRVESFVLEYADMLYDEYLFMDGSPRRPGCYRRLKQVDEFWLHSVLETFAIERLERKTNDIKLILQQTVNDWDECFYRLLCKYWAGNVNSVPFYQLALHLPYKTLLRYADRDLAIEALLFGCAGFLETVKEDEHVLALRKEWDYLCKKHKIIEMAASQWKFMRIRPNAFPSIRLAMLASFISRFRHCSSEILNVTSLSEAERLLDVSASVYWDNHYKLGCESSMMVKQTGASMKRTIIINAVIPFLFVYGKERGEEKYVDRALEWLQKLPPESNYIISSWEKCGLTFDSALQTQALIQLSKEYCEMHRCLKCKVGREVLKSVR